MTTPDNIASQKGAIIAIKATDGSVRQVQSTISIPGSTATGQTFALARFDINARVGSLDFTNADLDTSNTVRLDVGFIYDDNALTDDLDAFIFDVTPDTAKITARNAVAGIAFIAAGAGYIVASVRAANTTTTGDVSLNAAISYDS